MPAVSKTLIEKIAALPAERIAETEDFVNFLPLRERGAAADCRRRCRKRSGFCSHLEQSR